MEEIVWTVETFETRSGDKVVDDFVKNQQPQAKAKIAHTVNLLEKHGNRLGMPHSKALGSGLFEMRIRGKEEIRILYCFKDRTIWLLHGFKKQTQQTPQKEINIAIQRMISVNLTSV